MWSRPWVRWFVPVAAVLAIAATVLVAGNASADEKLPPRSAEQLLVDLQQAEIDGFSGTVEQSADLGVPALPGVSEHGSDFASLISGTHTLRVAYANPDRSKVALLGDLSESSIIRSGNEVWTWSSRDNEATHGTLDEDQPGADDPPNLPSDAPKTPQEAAQRMLAAVDETTTVGTDSDVTVAGRAAYELVLQPQDTRSLISSVRIAVDGAEHVALRVQVFAGDRPDPVASTGFTEVDFTRPADAEFAFTPPEGATVTEIDEGDHGTDGTPETPEREAAEPTVVGDGWTTVVIGRLPAGDLPDETADERAGRAEDGPDVQAYLAQLPTVSGDWGSGRLLAGTAFSVVITDDGRVAAGAVAPDLLYAALG
jgi:outer membrane lipoprotein-sorting protein